MHQFTTPSLSQTIWPRWASRQLLSLPIVQTLVPVTFGYSLNSEAVVMWQLRRWKRLWRRSLIRSHKRASMGPSGRCWYGTTSGLQPEEITWKGTRVLCVYYQWKCPYEKRLETYLMIFVFLNCLRCKSIENSHSAFQTLLFLPRIIKYKNQPISIENGQTFALLIIEGLNTTGYESKFICIHAKIVQKYLEVNRFDIVM